MMNTLRSIYSFMVLLSLLVMMGCVGTVQEAKAPDALKLLLPPDTFNFPGIMIARPISHNKVELEFFPAPNDGVVYQLFVNDSDTPIPIDPQSLLRVSGGRLLYTVEGLLPDREYKFKITANNNKTGALSTGENEVYARTYDNIVADFKGVSKLSLVPGNTSGAILVDWIAPTMSGVFTSGPFDPAHYEVSIISQIGGVGNLNNPYYTGSDRRVVMIPSPPLRATPISNPASAIIENLQGGTTYYVQVRAINTLYQNYDEDPDITVIPVSREMNTRYLTIKTDAAGGLFDFRQDNVVLANAPGVEAFDKIDIFWQPGSGSFSHYKLFIRKYDGIGDASIDDKLTEPTMIALAAAGGGVGALVYNVASNFTTKRATGLDSYGTYQVKVALCKNISCPLASSDPQGAIISDLKSITVQPTLAGFNGVNGIQPPGQFNEKDTVKLTFDAPLIGTGYANLLEFYCVDPEDHSQQVKFDGNNPIVGSSIPRCNGLYLDGAAPPLSSYTWQKVRNLNTTGTVEYCFSATPAIVGYIPEIRIGTPGRIVRCSYPQVFPPTVAQFPGLKGSCAVAGTKANVSWNLPTGGIYSGFKVFWKEKKSDSKFSFADAVLDADDVQGPPHIKNGNYFDGGDLTANDVTYQLEDLVPGRTYQVGVVSTTDMTPNPMIYSEYNLQVLDCIVPLPVAEFKGFSRIFAVGPKIDGRVPNDPATKAPPTSAWVYEALDSIGQPYEVAMTTATEANVSLNYTAPPGRDAPVNFGGEFDGIKNATNSYAMSKTGIISLAWEEVDMKTPAGVAFTDADALFAAAMTPAAPRANRQWGYKVYRSSDNKLTWKELTTTTGLIYSTDYTYRHRSTDAPVTKRMAFFTDYSVQAVNETHDAATARDIDRARIYDYKIVPVFDGKALTYETSNHNIVRVTLPPPNMALVHRWMANRGRCLEIDKNPDIALNYSCTYNGVGSTPLGIPHRVGDTALDQGGDLLIDRFELGCRYTRGDKIINAETGASHFDKGGLQRRPEDDNYWPMFKGFSNIGTGADSTTPFRGCGGENSQTWGTGVGADYPPGFVDEYSRVLQGDCIGNHVDTVYSQPCTTQQLTDGYVTQLSVMSPGVSSFGGPVEACDIDTASNPTTLTTKLMGIHAANYLMQSEFLAVFHNTYGGGAYALQFEGPTNAAAPDQIGTLNNFAYWTSNNCSINLAAIDGSGYMKPRWLTMDQMHSQRTLFKGVTQPLYSKTVAEITEVKRTAPLTFYNGDDSDCSSPTGAGCPAYKLPPLTLRQSPRYRTTTSLSRIFSSNSSKLPPLGKMGSEQAQYLCNNFFVQVGFADEAMTQFAAEQAAKPKRSLRRQEFVTAAAWNETYDATAIDGIEKSTNPGSCNNVTKNNPGSWFGKGSTHLNTMSFETPVNSPILTGSSYYMGLSTQTSNFNTAKCVSKYGIQDLVGNLAEYSSDRLFCDYSKDAIWMGPVNGAGWSGGNGIVNQGKAPDAGDPVIPQFGFFNSNTERDWWWVLKNGVLSNDTPVQLKLNFRDAGFPTRTDIMPWAQIGTDSGYCSPVDDNPTKRTSMVDAFKNVSTGAWTPVYLPGGAINPAIIERTQADQDSVFSWRNGDGRFLDFGPQGMGAPINKANTLGLGTASGNKYFNPIIGLPLKCNGNQNASCADSSLVPPIDNLEITTATLAPNLDLGNPADPLDDVDYDPTIDDFPIGNSLITNLGISEFNFNAAGEDVIKVTPNSNGYTVVTEVLVDNPTTMGNKVYTIKNFPSDFKVASDLKYYSVKWDVYRGTEFTFLSGGKSTDPSTGRYSANLATAAVYGIPNGAGTGTLNIGTRCAVMINQD